jgi:hydrogenase maturation protease
MSAGELHTTAIAASAAGVRPIRAQDMLAGGIIVGLGNPFLSDDAVGLAVARRVHETLALPGIELRELATGGVELIETLVGFRAAVVIDAIQMEGGTPGACQLVDLRAPWPVLRAGSSHEIGLLEGLALGRRLGLAVPYFLRLYAIAVADPFTFGTRMTRAVEEAVPHAAARIAAEVRGELSRHSSQTGLA